MDDNVTYEPLELNQHSGEFACPACGVRSRFRIIGTIKVRDIEQVGAEEIAERVPIASTAAAEAMKAAGIWDAFRQAIDKLQIKPKYPEDFADAWLRTAVVLKKIRPEVMRYVFEEFGYDESIWREAATEDIERLSQQLAALTGRLDEHHAYLLGEIVRVAEAVDGRSIQMDFASARLTAVEGRVETIASDHRYNNLKRSLDRLWGTVAKLTGEDEKEEQKWDTDDYRYQPPSSSSENPATLGTCFACIDGHLNTPHPYNKNVCVSWKPGDGGSAGPFTDGPNIDQVNSAWGEGHRDGLVGYERWQARATSAEAQAKHLSAVLSRCEESKNLWESAAREVDGQKAVAEQERDKYRKLCDSARLTLGKAVNQVAKALDLPDGGGGADVFAELIDRYRKIQAERADVEGWLNQRIKDLTQKRDALYESEQQQRVRAIEAERNFESAKTVALNYAREVTTGHLKVAAASRERDAAVREAFRLKRQLRAARGFIVIDTPEMEIEALALGFPPANLLNADPDPLPTNSNPKDGDL